MNFHQFLSVLQFQTQRLRIHMFLTLFVALYEIGLVSRCFLELFDGTNTLHIADSFGGRNTPLIFASHLRSLRPFMSREFV